MIGGVPLGSTRVFGSCFLGFVIGGLLNLQRRFFFSYLLRVLFPF